MAKHDDKETGPKTWVTEHLFNSYGFQMSFQAERVLLKKVTQHQSILLFESKHFGRVLMIDGATQLTTADEFIYHEMMSHVPILAHGAARKVLIIGGGDCGIAKETLKFASIEQVLLVEIDSEVIELARNHLTELSRPAFSDPRFVVICEDGGSFLARTRELFDVIIVDSTDPQGPGSRLFSSSFYEACKRRLTPGGVLVTQQGVPFFQLSNLVNSLENLRGYFRDVSCYIAAVPTYVGGHMALGWSTDDTTLRHLTAATIASRYKEAGSFRTRYWTPEIHEGSFALPRYIAEQIAPGNQNAK
jgi:spermidine synthase